VYRSCSSDHLSGLLDQAGMKDEKISSMLPEALQVYKDELSSARGAVMTGSNSIVALILEIAKVNWTPDLTKMTWG